jgi:hypothetical protein
LKIAHWLLIACLAGSGPALANDASAGALEALIDKMPLVTQNLMSEVQGQMKPMQEKIQQIQRAATQELKDLPAK